MKRENYIYKNIQYNTSRNSRIGESKMKIIVEVDPEKGDRIIRFARVAPNGQISGCKDFAGREGLVIILGEKKGKKGV